MQAEIEPSSLYYSKKMKTVFVISVMRLYNFENGIEKGIMLNAINLINTYDSRLLGYRLVGGSTRNVWNVQFVTTRTGAHN